MIKTLNRQNIKNLLIFLFLIIGLFFLYFYHLGQIGLIDMDESRYAESVREMIAMKSYLIPYLNYEPRLNKPIFFYWLLILSYKIFGINELAARFWSASFGICGIFLCFWFGRKFLSHNIGVVSAIVLATNSLYFLLSNIAITDMTFSFFISVSLISFYTIFEKGKGCSSSSLIIFYLSISLATLTKGPVGIILPFLIILCFLIYTHKLSIFKYMKVTQGILGILLLILPWFIYTYLIFLPPSKSWGLIFNEVIGRFFKEYGHSEPIYYFILIILGGFFPWSFFLPQSIIKSFKSIKKENPLKLYLLFRSSYNAQ